MSGDANVAVVGRIVRARREKLGLTQADLEARGGPVERTVNRLEQPVVTARPRVRTLRELETALVLPEGTLSRVLSGELVEGSDDLAAMVNGQVMDGDLARGRTRGQDGAMTADARRQEIADRARPTGDPSDPNTRIRGATGALARAVDTLTRNPSPSPDEEMALVHIMDALGQLRAPVEWDPAAQRYWVVDRGPSQPGT